MEEQKVMLVNAVPAVRELRQVKGFDPLKFLKRDGGGTPKLDLRYKRLWFRLACPNGRMLLKALRLTDQMAIYEAQVFMSRDEDLPIANFTATVLEKDAPGGAYVRAAQDEALDVALDNAGFGIQLCEVSADNEAAPAANVNQEAEKTEGAMEPARDAEAVSSEKPVAAEPSAADPASSQAEETVQANASENVPGPAPTDVKTKQQESVQEAAAESQAGVASLLQTITGQGNAQAVPASSEEEAPDSDAAPKGETLYSEDMTVEDIYARISLEEAGKLIVPFGFCNGWTLSQVADQRPASLKWLAHGCENGGNILKAAALLLYENMQQKAG